MSWSSNNDDNSPWGKSSSNKRKPYNGSGGANNDDFFDNIQEKLKGFFPKKKQTGQRVRYNTNSYCYLGCKWILSCRNG